MARPPRISALRVFEATEGSKLVVIPSSVSVSLKGYGDISVLYGEILCCGAKLTSKNSCWTPICSAPVLGPAISIKNVTGTSTEKRTFVQRLQQRFSEADVREILADFHPAFAYLLVRPIEEGSWNLKMLAKTFKSLFSFNENDPESFMVLPTLELFFTDKKCRKEIMKEKLSEEGTLASEAQQQVVMIVGPTGIGKSTFLRCLYNGYLSETADAEVWLLDLDLGQPEFTPPGCVSLHRLSQPLISPPFFHLTNPTRSYFVGSTNYADHQQVYLKLVSQLIEDFKTVATQNAHLFVNTAGWIQGMGYDVMACLINMIKPSQILELQFRSREESPSSFFKLAAVENSFKSARDLGLFVSSFSLRNEVPLGYQLSVMTVQVESDNDGKKDMISRDVRDLMLMAYFGRSVTSECQSLLGLKPFVVSWHSVGLSVSHNLNDYPPVPDQFIMAVLNGSLVALCHCAQEHILDRHFNEDLSLPKKICPNAIPLCVGFGLVRGVDMKAKLLLIVTPLSHEQLTSVNCLFKGDIEVPSAVFSSQPNNLDCPYLMRNRKDPEGTAQPAVTKTARFKTRRMKRRYSNSH